MRYWEKLRSQLNMSAVDAAYTLAIERTGDKDRLRILREHVMLVVRDYNKIINALNPQASPPLGADGR